jgi:UPF0755 protein
MQGNTTKKMSKGSKGLLAKATKTSRPVAKKRALFILNVAGAALLALAIFLFALYNLNGAPDNIKESVIFRIERGEGASRVGQRLHEAGIMKSPLLWKAMSIIRIAVGRKAYMFGWVGTTIKAGTYKIDTKSRASDILDMFISGSQMLVSVTIPEGSTIKKTAALLQESGICTAEDFITATQNKTLLSEYRISGDSAEGYLYPDTYLFNLNHGATDVVRFMIKTFYEKLQELGVDAESLSDEDLSAKVILASIIEREYRVDEEAAVMAGVFQNRITQRMKLESCATVEYIITEINGKAHPTRLFYSDLEIDNPYNTYLYRGLPPGPISNPGAVALGAAFFPDKNEYLFFRIVDVGSGRHYFSKTFDDHIKAGLLYVKSR